MMHQQLGLFDSVVDEAALVRTAARFAERRILLPTFAQLKDPPPSPRPSPPPWTVCRRMIPIP